MSLLNAHQQLLAAGRPRPARLEPTPPAQALSDMLRFADSGRSLASVHPWELAPATCRALEDEFGYTPPGGWSRLAGLAAGADVLHARPTEFVPLATPGWVHQQSDGGRRRMVEAFTRRLIPPAAAAALYVALDIHPLWGLELGRDVGASDSNGVSAGAKTALPVVRELVFGTMTGMLTSLRCLEYDRSYPVDGLGDVLWWSAVCARTLSCADATRHGGLPVFLDGTCCERRMLTTRLAVGDLLDFVLVPAGVARRDDSGWFAVDRDALIDVRVGDWDLEQQVGWWNDALVVQHRAAC